MSENFKRTITPIEKQFEFWSNNADRIIKIDGLTYRISVGLYNARYPYVHQVMNVNAVPTEETLIHPEYLEVKAELGDDWMIDLEKIDIEKLTDIVEQLGKVEEYIEALS
jgi:hypothetical protein